MICSGSPYFSYIFCLIIFPEVVSMSSLQTWAGKSRFSYTGSVKEGTTITYGEGHKIKIKSAEYESLLKNFSGLTVEIGTSRDKPPKGSMCEWLQIF
jgi:hypothetical protein